jgi:hypothetical protein
MKQGEDLHTIGISLPSFILTYGIYGSCLGGVPEASGSNVDPMEFMVDGF